MAVVAGIVIGGAVVKGLFGIKSASKKKQAAKILRQLQKRRNARRRRQFMARFRDQQSELLLAGTQEGGLESSRFQGQRASQETQFASNLGENRDTQLRGDKASRLLGKAADLDAIGNLVGDLSSSVGSALV